MLFIITTNYRQKYLPNFDTLITKEKEYLIAKYCKSLKIKLKNKKYVYFPYINVAVHSQNILVYKIFFNENTYEIIPFKAITLPRNNEKFKFCFDKGTLEYIENLQDMNQYKVENNFNELRIKFIQNKDFHITSIKLNENFLWLNNLNDICKKTDKTFPIPISEIIDKTNISTLVLNDSLFAKKKQVAGYGKFGSKFKYNQYGDCRAKKFQLKFCPNNSVYTGKGQCIELNVPIKTCLEFPQALLKHPSNNNKYLKCLRKYPFYKEKLCPVNYIFDIKNMKCSFVDLCTTSFNRKIAIPENLKSAFPKESYIECINGQAITRNCSNKFLFSKLSESGDRCCDIECIENMNIVSLINIKNDNPQSFIRSYPGHIKICKHGELVLSEFHQKPILRKVREAVIKNEVQKINVDKLELKIIKGEIEYELPTFIYTINDRKKVEKKYLQSFRDAPELFFVRKIPVNSINTKEKNIYVYIDDNVHTHINEDLIYREEPK